MVNVMKYFLCIILLTLVCRPCIAQYETKEIIVNGNERVTKSDILMYSGLSIGHQYDERDIDRALKKLYGTRLFLNASIGNDHGILSITVEESPIITRVAFEGNKTLDTSDLSKQIKLSIGNIYNTKAVDEDAYAILNHYKKMGYMFAKIEPQLVKESKDKVIVIYKITEGKRAKIYSISFIGNTAFPSSTLKTAIFSQEYIVLKILSPFIKYDPTRIEFDKEALRLFYLNKGYIDFNIIDVNSELTDGKAHITFKIEEGTQYRYGTIKASEKLAKLVDVQKIIKSNKLRVEKDVIYNEGKTDKLILLLEESLQNKGYFFTEIKKQVIKEDGYANLELGILDAQKAYINRIDITGNTRTKDNVIRRQISFIEGDSYNKDKVEKSRANIIKLGYFSTVEIIHKIVSPNQVDVEFKVNEEPTGNINVSAGYTLGADDIGMSGLNGNINIKESNIAGSGCTLLASLEATAHNKSISFGFTDPFFLDMDLKSSFSLGYNVNTRHARNENKTDQDKVYYYQTATYGGSYGIEYKLADNLFHNIEYALYKRELNKSDSSVEIKSARSMDYAENTVASSVRNTLSYITIDNPSRPRNGSIITINQEVAGLIGGVQFIKHSAYFRKYFPIFKERDNISITARAGNVFALGTSDRVLLIDNFTPNSTIGYVRGFTTLGCGVQIETPPKVEEGVGGKSFYALNLEASLYVNSIETLKELSFKVMAFCDIGAMFDADLSKEQNKQFRVLSSNAPRISAGFGIGLELPMLGKVSIYYSPEALIKQESFDKISQIGFVLGQDF